MFLIRPCLFFPLSLILIGEITSFPFFWHRRPPLSFRFKSIDYHTRYNDLQLCPESKFARCHLWMLIRGLKPHLNHLSLHDISCFIAFKLKTINVSPLVERVHVRMNTVNGKIKINTRWFSKRFNMNSHYLKNNKHKTNEVSHFHKVYWVTFKPTPLFWNWIRISAVLFCKSITGWWCVFLVDLILNLQWPPHKVLF